MGKKLTPKGEPITVGTQRIQMTRFEVMGEITPLFISHIEYNSGLRWHEYNNVLNNFYKLNYYKNLQITCLRDQMLKEGVLSEIDRIDFYDGTAPLCWHAQNLLSYVDSYHVQPSDDFIFESSPRPLEVLPPLPFDIHATTKSCSSSLPFICLGALAGTLGIFAVRGKQVTTKELVASAAVGAGFMGLMANDAI